MKMCGYCGRILQVDLTTRQVTRQDLDTEIAKKFIGGFGVSLRLAYDLIRPNINPLSPDNAIILGAGPFVGTLLPGAIKSTVVTKYPLTNNIAAGSTSMALGRRLKFAGYDNVIITGRADHPVYIKIFNDDVEICDARHLWGMKDSFQTADDLWQEVGRNYSLITIGQAGENLVRCSFALVDKMSTVGKGGLPAIMGSINLKAIAVGGNKKVEVFNPRAFKELLAPLLKLDREEKKSERWKQIGKASAFEPSAKVGIPYKNSTEIYPYEDAMKKYGDNEILKVQGKRVGCPGCPHPCKDILEVKHGEYKGLRTNVSSIAGRLLHFGPHCGAETIEQIVKLIDMSARYGIDSQIFAPATELAIELYQRGIITKEDTEGFVLNRDFETTVELLKKVAFRQGIGNILANGTLGLIGRFGRECEKYSTHIKGLEAQSNGMPPKLDTRGFGLITNPEGGSIVTGGNIPDFKMTSDYTKDMYTKDSMEYRCRRIGMTKDAIDRIIYQPGGLNVARLSKYIQDFSGLLDCLGICGYKIDLYDVGKFAEIYSAITGIEIDSDEIKKGSERVYNQFKVINVREGQSRKDDRVPQKWFKPIKTADGKEIYMRNSKGDIISVDDVEKLLDDYYEERGWEVETGIPSKRKLVDLDLTNVAKDFVRLKILK